MEYLKTFQYDSLKYIIKLFEKHPTELNQVYVKPTQYLFKSAEYNILKFINHAHNSVTTIIK